MARSRKPTIRKPTINVKGLSISDIMNMSLETFNKLGESDLRAVTTRLVSAGNKRIRRFEKAGEDTPLLTQIRKSGGNFSTSKIPVGKQQSVNMLRAEFSRVKDFLGAETGTIAGWNKARQKSIRELAKKTGGTIDLEKTALQNLELWAGETGKYVDKKMLNKEQKKALKAEVNRLYDQYWRSYREIELMNPDVKERNLKYEVLDTLNEFLLDNAELSPGEVAGIMAVQVNSLYEKQKQEEEERRGGDTGVSKYFRNR